jgi:hypothetical protein
MDHYAGIDVSLEASSVCVVDGAGKIRARGEGRSEPAVMAGAPTSLSRHRGRSRIIQDQPRHQALPAGRCQNNRGRLFAPLA